MNVKLGNCKTSAQAVTKICYNEPTRNLDFRIQCKDLEDLKRCVRIIKGYNDFDWEKVNKALDAWANFKRINNTDLLTYEIGREGSPVIYIRYSLLGLSGNYQKGNQIKKLTDKLFKKSMETLAGLARADECHFTVEFGYKYCRLWWD